MDADDREIGRILSRREALAVLGSSAAVMLGYSHLAATQHLVLCGLNRRKVLIFQTGR